MNFLAGMDPNLFHLNWERVSEVLVAIILVSLLVERFLAVIFESYWFIKRLDDKHIKEWIALGFALIVCAVWDFDAVSMIILADRTNPFGWLVTAGIIAGGSKASVKLFRDWLNIKSRARKAKEAGKPLDGGPEGGGDPPTPPPPPENGGNSGRKSKKARPESDK